MSWHDFVAAISTPYCTAIIAALLLAVCSTLMCLCMICCNVGGTLDCLYTAHVTRRHKQQRQAYGNAPPGESQVAVPLLPQQQQQQQPPPRPAQPQFKSLPGFTFGQSPGLPSFAGSAFTPVPPSTGRYQQSNPLYGGPRRVG